MHPERLTKNWEYSYGTEKDIQDNPGGILAIDLIDAEMSDHSLSRGSWSFGKVVSQEGLAFDTHKDEEWKCCAD